ncbi:CPBP family intramembrane glutamic endopeptidase [Streptococcus cuniculipharyngis]|uniref:CPBP family intramembrane metalloprotease n=1 Tax=Streptococcus cuniculipharyngis TaxID=1562651 RepID=A0A5C5SG12_9STRE|nr:CPBP family intramembrane glutamic endopeptidase [Streptococcus cuniculipharyngis]TWS98841.1 CPBP family intramembrane metalloprotease [Streptococcus cuniculipharyngis]
MKTYLDARIWKFIGLYLYQYVNTILVSLYLGDQLSLWEVLVCQLLYLTSLTWLLKKSSRYKFDQSRLVWLVTCLGSMFLMSVLVGILWPVTSANQTSLISVQSQLPLMVFILFLTNASLVEELVYRGYLWSLFPKPYQALLVTSLVFALAHQPDSLGGWLVYGSLGLGLGVMRQQTDLVGATMLHLVWNGLVLLTTFL